MITWRIVFIAALLFLLPVSFTAQQKDDPGNWVDHASADYDIQPNITYATANNTDLKLDLYLPKDKSKPSPTLVLFHGGGWVDGA